MLCSISFAAKALRITTVACAALQRPIRPNILVVLLANFTELIEFVPLDWKVQKFDAHLAERDPILLAHQPEG